MLISVLLLGACGSGAPATTTSSAVGNVSPTPESPPTFPAPSATDASTPVESVAPAPTSTPSAPAPHGSAPLPMGQGPAPTAVAIPSIAVDEQLIDLGIADDGTAEVPADYARAGWFAGGGRPGGVGPTVILGHVDSLDGPAVFHRLRDVPVGADIDVQLADGTTAQYRVESTAQYAKADFPTFEVYGATPVDTLTLITCGGPFDTDALSYTENVVVTALRV